MTQKVGDLISSLLTTTIRGKYIYQFSNIWDYDVPWNMFLNKLMPHDNYAGFLTGEQISKCLCLLRDRCKHEPFAIARAIHSFNPLYWPIKSSISNKTEDAADNEFIQIKVDHLEKMHNNNDNNDNDENNDIKMNENKNDNNNDNNNDTTLDYIEQMIKQDLDSNDTHCGVNLDNSLLSRHSAQSECPNFLKTFDEYFYKNKKRAYHQIQEISSIPDEIKEKIEIAKEDDLIPKHVMISSVIQDIAFKWLRNVMFIYERDSDESDIIIACFQKELDEIDSTQDAFDAKINHQTCNCNIHN